jgi:Spy/CpxP family protein refolding chaperone
MKKLSIIGIIAIFAAVTVIIAQPMNSKGIGYGNKGMMTNLPGYDFYEIYQSELGINNSQMEKLKNIYNTFLKERIDLQAKIRHSGLDLKNQLDNNSVNKEQALSKQDAVTKLRDQMQKKALTYKIDLNNVLTDEQKAKIDDIRIQCRKDGLSKSKSRRGQRDGTGRGQRGSGRGMCR